MTHDPNPTDERWSRLARATESIVPTSDFSVRVMAAVGAQSQRDVSSWIARLGPVTIPAAAVIAGVLAFWAIENNGDYHDALMVASYDVEQDW